MDIISLVFISVVLYLMYLLTRVNRTYRFLGVVINATHGYMQKFLKENCPLEESDYNKTEKRILSLAERYIDNYETMVLSFKPFTLEAWYTSEEVEILQEGLEYYNLYCDK